MTSLSDRHNGDARASSGSQAKGSSEQDVDERIVTDTNLVLGCAASIALLTVFALIAYLWTL